MMQIYERPPTGRRAALAQACMAPVPVLVTRRLRLRAMTLADFPAWAEILCSDRSRYMDGPYDRDEAYSEFAATAGEWALHGLGFWTVTLAEGGEAIGFTGLNAEPSNNDPELGWFLRAAAEGRGYAREAAAAVRDWALAEGFPALVSYIDPDNSRSRALARALGARRDPLAEAAYAGTPDAGVEVWRHFPEVTE